MDCMMVARKWRERVRAGFWNEAQTIRFPLQEMCQNGNADNEGKQKGGFEDCTVLLYFVLFYSGLLPKPKRIVSVGKKTEFVKKSQNVR